MDTAMEFENTMRLLFGEKAYHIADEHGSTKGRRDWMTKALKLLTREIDALDSTTRHKQNAYGRARGNLCLGQARKRSILESRLSFPPSCFAPIGF